MYCIEMFQFKMAVLSFPVIPVTLRSVSSHSSATLWV